MDIDVLNSTFAVQPNPGLDTLDPRWAEVSGLVQAGDFKAAAEQSEGLLREAVYDIRLIGYLCFGLFLERGPAALPAIFESLANVLNNNFEAIGPAASRAKSTQTSLGWLLKQTSKKIQREDSTKGDVWKRWISELTSDSVEEALSGIFLLQKATETALGELAPPVLESLGKLREWLQAVRNAVAKPVEAAPPTPEPAPAAESAPAEPAPRAAEASTDGLTVERSFHLSLLLKKLQLFERLVEAGKFAQARIVADDLAEIIASFDPTLYFPSLFANFTKLMARHVGEMVQFENDRDSPSWKAMQALYRVDLNEFFEF